MRGIAVAGGLSGIGTHEDLEIALRGACRTQHQPAQPLALLLIEIDYYRPYQAFCGIAAGDDCLDAVAAAILETAREPDSQAFACGPGRFALLVPDTNQRQAERLGAEIRFQVEALVIPHPRSPVARFVTVSIGIAAAHSDSNAEELIREAEFTLDRGQTLGHDRRRTRVHKWAASV
jgi:two-component system cell cycle response regulator